MLAVLSVTHKPTFPHHLRKTALAHSSRVESRSVSRAIWGQLGNVYNIAGLCQNLQRTLVCLAGRQARRLRRVGWAVGLSVASALLWWQSGSIAWRRVAPVERFKKSRKLLTLYDKYVQPREHVHEPLLVGGYIKRRQLKMTRQRKFKDNCVTF